MTRKQAIKILKWIAEIYDNKNTVYENQALTMAIEAIEEKQAGGWISAEDRLPEEPEEEYLEYIVMIENARISTFLYYDGNGEWKDDCGIPYRVTHWQPLPEPPQKGE